MMYEFTRLARYSGKNHMDQCITDTCNMYRKWTRVLYSVVITRQSNPLMSQFNSLCNEFTSVWSMFVCYNMVY